MNELRNRGVEDILLAVVDGLKGFPDAVRAVFPEAWFRPAWFTCYSTAWISSLTRIENPSRPC